jgi:hypothetical protein
MAEEPKDSVLLIPKTTTGNSPEPVPSTSEPHNYFPKSKSMLTF